MGSYTDHGVSGATSLRLGYQALLADARSGKFDVVFAESLDRFSRDQEHIAGFFKQMSFAGGDRRETGGAGTSWVFSRLISDRGWGRGMDFEAGANRRRG